MADKKSGKLFYGWIIVAAGVLVTGATIGVFNNTLSVFVKPVTESLGFARGEFTLYSSISSIAGMMAAPVYGEFFRKGKNKQVMLICSLLVVLAALGYSFSSQLWHFYACAAITGAAIQGCSNMAVATLINNWFYEKKGTATGIALAGTGLFGSVMVPIVTWVIGAYGWQWGYRLLSAVGVAVLFPVITLFMRARPEEMGLTPYGARPQAEAEEKGQEEEIGFTRGQVLKMPSFYLVMAGMFLTLLAGICMQGHLMSHLTDIGYSSAFASRVVSAAMIALMVGKIAMGWVFDRFGVMVGCISAAVSAGVGLAALIFSYIPGVPYLAAAGLGYTLALGSVASSLITNRYFGARDFARVYVIANLGGGFGGIVGQPFGGFVYDLTGSYNGAWMVGIGLVAVSSVLFMLGDRSNKRAWDRLIAQQAEKTNNFTAYVAEEG